MRSLPLKTTLVILTFTAVVLAPNVIPSLAAYRLFDWYMVTALVDFRPRKRPANQEAEWKRRFHPDAFGVTARGGWKDGIYQLDETGGALNHFYEALSQTEAELPGAVTRIVHYGDSPTTADMITGDAREQLQNKYGDAGKGFCLITKPWAWYDHRGITMEGKGWKIDPATQSHIRDGRFGLGGVSFLSDGGAVSRFKWKGPGPEQVEVAFLKLPGGGTFTVSAGDTLLGEVKTDGADLASGFQTFDVPPDAREIEVRATGGPIRLFGITFDRPGPGVEYDSIGLNGAYVTILARFFNEAHWAEQLQHRKPDLVVINYDTNESAYTTFVDKQYARELKEIVRRVRTALPAVSILLMSPMDRGTRQAGGLIGTLPNIPRIVAMQQKVANENGCAFFNTFEAMGGDGTMGRWYEGEPRMVGADFIHPMPAGAKIVGNLLYQALLDGYHRYKVRQAQELMRKKIAAVTKP